MHTFEETTMSGSMETSTLGTGPGGILSRNFNDFNTLPFSLVGQELLELIEAPVMQPSVESSTFALFTNSLERLQYDCVTSFESPDYLLGNLVVNMSHEAVFPPSYFSKQSLAGAGAFSLKLGSEVSELGFSLLYPPAFEELAIGSDSQFVDSQVNTDYLSVATKRSVGINLIGKYNMDKQSPLPSVKYKVGRTDLPFKILPEVFWDCDWYSEPSLHRGERNLIILEAETPCVISDCCELLADGFPSIELVCLEYITGDIPATANKLCWELAMLTDTVISNVMKLPFIKIHQFPAPVKHSLDCPRVLFHGFKKFLFNWKSHFDCGNGFHSRYLMQGFKYFKGERRFLSPLKQGVSSPKTL